MKLNVEQILTATGGKLIAGNKNQTIEDFSINSRIIRPHEAFIAIRGERFDGHSFIKESYRKGVRFYIIQKYKNIKPEIKDSVLIMVKDTKKALADIAHYVRKLSKVPLIGITGSNGKTTTKDMTASILNSRYKVLKNVGTQNNEIGLPLTLLKLKEQHEVIVLEMGMNHADEIKKLNEVALADIGVITSIHPAHLKYLKNINNVAKAKWQLIRSLKRNKMAILNNDDEKLRSLIARYKSRLITFGIYNKSDFQASDIKSDQNKITFKVNRKHKITLKLIGNFNIYNALAAISVARFFKISYHEIEKSLLRFKAQPMRMQKIEVNGITLINDGYNANPVSFMLAVETLSKLIKKGKSIMVCCDMLELGKLSKQFHRQVGRRVAKANIDYLISLGQDARWINQGALEGGMKKDKIHYASSAKKAAYILKSIARPKDIILLKGSRLMKTEEIVKCFTNYFIH